MKKLLLVALVPVLAVLVACGGGSKKHKQPPQQKSEMTFEYIGLKDHIVVQLKAYDDEETLYAATNKGLHVLIDDEWELLTPADWNVNAIELIDQQHILASVSFPQTEKLMESLDAGETWTEVESNFGGEWPEQIRYMVYEHDDHVLYAAGKAVLAKSEDYGREWTIVYGDWWMEASGLSAIGLHSSGDIWIGGQGGIESPTFQQIKVDGEAVDHSAPIAELLPPPSVIRSIHFFPEEGKSTHSDRVLATGEGGIVHSLDYGETWLPVLLNDHSRFYFDLVIDPDNSSTLYTAGWDKNWESPQELRLEISDDAGKTWTAHRHNDDQLLGGVWSMKLRMEGEKKLLYLGLCEGGVFKVKLP